MHDFRQRENKKSKTNGYTRTVMKGFVRCYKPYDPNLYFTISDSDAGLIMICLTVALRL